MIVAIQETNTLNYLLFVQNSIMNILANYRIRTYLKGMQIIECLTSRTRISVSGQILSKIYINTITSFMDINFYPFKAVMIAISIKSIVFSILIFS